MVIQGFHRLLSMLLFLALAQSSVLSASEVIPDFYRDPGLYPNRSYINQSFHESIDPFTGALQQHYVDIHLPGNGGFDLKVIRSYNSASVEPLNMAGSDMLAGLGWTVHFGRVMSKSSSICINANTLSTMDNPILELPDGSRQLLVFTGGTSPLLLTAQRWRADCSSATLSVYSPDGVRYDMKQLVNVGTSVSPTYAWYATRITDRNGNYASLTYSGTGSPQITSVTTNDGRSLSFTYADTGLFSRRITSVSGEGQTYNYNYQAISGVASRYFLSSVTRPDGRSWSYLYNTSMASSGGSYMMNRVTYPQGGYINYGYGTVYFDTQTTGSQTSVITSKKLSTGGNWSFSYTPGGIGVYDTTKVVSPIGTTTYKHVGANYSASGSVWMIGLLISKTVGALQTETYTWAKQKISNEKLSRPGDFSVRTDLDTNAPLLSQKVIARNGQTYKTVYSSFDGYGNPGKVTETGPNGGSRATTLTYYINTSKWIVNQAMNESYTGRNITRSFNSNGMMTSIKRDGVTTSYDYDSEGNISSVTFPRYLTHHFSSYKRGIPRSESQPEGISISRSVSGAGNVTSETNGDGKTTSYSYDNMNRLTYIYPPLGNATHISYGQKSKTVNRGGLIESTTYDGFGRQTAIALGGISRSYTVDALGRNTFISNPGAGGGKNYQYDMLDRLTRITNEDSTTRSISYGAASITVTDERGKASVTKFRSYGDPEQQFVMSITAADASANISIARNSVDKATTVTQAGVTRTFGYNANGYLVSAVNPETGTTLYGRDAAGNMITRQVGASGTTTYTYDGQNRLIAVTYPSASQPAVTQTYNKTHRLLSVTSPTATRLYSYNANNGLLSESLLVGGYTLTAGYVYNNNDQLVAQTYPWSGTSVEYSPDVLGRPTQVSGYVSSVSYWPSGQVNQLVYLNGTVTTYGQNNRLWPNSFNVAKSGINYLNSNYTYDGVGNLTVINDMVDSSYNRTLGYDNINRLTSVYGSWGSGSLTYNGTGNITSQSLGATNLTYSYDSYNRLIGVIGNFNASYGYDVYGGISNISGQSFTYDDTQNMKCAYCTNPLNRIDYAYDGKSQRVSVTKGGITTYEMYGAGGNLLVEFTPSQSNKLVQYFYLGGKRIAQKVTP